VCAIAMPDDPQGDTIHFTLPHRLVRVPSPVLRFSMQKILELANREDLIEDQC
jgi:hypothetical protein